MKNLLKLEFRKLKRQKSFYICLAIMAGMLFIMGATAKVLMEYAEQIAEMPGGEVMPTTFSSFLLGFESASSFSMLSAIFVSIVVCDDYESHTVKNIIARGYSRTAHYFSKLIYVFTATTIMFVIVVFLAGVIGGLFLGFGELSGETILLIAGQYVVCMSGVALVFFIASSIKKLGASIAANIIVPIVIPLLLELADTALKSESFKFADVWIDSFLRSLTVSDVSAGRILACVLGSIAYGVAFILAGYFVNKKSEV